MTPLVHVTAESPAQPVVVALIEALDAYQQSLYPPESNHLLDIASLQRPEVLFAVARDEERRVVGCGAVVLHHGWAELKRMYVAPASRGRGVAKAILAWLQAQALRHGRPTLRLETGIHQAEALGLYERSGFAPRGRFGDYAEDPLSVFMEKRLPSFDIAQTVPDAADLEGLADTLQACVSAQGSVGFVQPLSADDARAFWSGLLPAVRSGARAMWLARQEGRVVGTVSLVLDAPPNGRHRAEVSKLLVHPDARRHGLARALMLALEDQARALGKRLLLLDTRTGDSAERLYRSLGFTLSGTVPEYAAAPDGSARRDATSIMYRFLG